jgi:hypothetical protein
MEQNVGNTDGLVRIVVGAVAGLVSLGIVSGTVGLPAILSPVLGLVAVILLVTGATNTCPLYSVLGLNTLRRARSR